MLAGVYFVVTVINDIYEKQLSILEEQEVLLTKIDHLENKVKTIVDIIDDAVIAQNNKYVHE